MILLANAEITADRARLRLIIAKGDANAQGRAWLDDQAARYGLAAENHDAPPPVRLAQRLLRHVDTVPVSLALAQAAAESGWGRSRFAHDGNALYGQWTMSESHGLAPQRRDAGKKHLVRQFSSLFELGARLHAQSQQSSGLSDILWPARRHGVAGRPSMGLNSRITSRRTPSAARFISMSYERLCALIALAVSTAPF